MSTTFTDGTEDLSIDVSDMVEDWMTGGSRASCSVILHTSATSTNLDTLGFRIVDSQGTVKDFIFDKDVTTANLTIGLSGLSSVSEIRDKIIESINNVSVLRVTAAAISDLGGFKAFSVTMDDIGLAGNKNGGLGDFEDSGSLDGTQYVQVNTDNFANGTGIPNYGFGVMLSGSFETGLKSYYTKKFFSRSSEYFFKRPVLEARWDSTEKDRAGNFYGASNLVSQDDQVNTIYFYNYVRGQLKDIPNLTNNLIYVTFHSGNADNSAVAEDAARLSIRNKGQADGQTAIAIEGGKISTGIYTASVIYPATPNDSNAAPSPSIIFPVWQDSTSNGGAAGIKFHTGSAITVKTFNDFNTNPSPEYVSKITNMKDSYSNNESARFRLYVREKTGAQQCILWQAQK